MIRLAHLPVAARRERDRTEPAHVEEIGADAPHRLRLTGDPYLPVSSRQRRSPDGCFEQPVRRGSPYAAVVNMEPVERDLGRALQRLLLVTIVDLDEDVGA